MIGACSSGIQPPGRKYSGMKILRQTLAPAGFLLAVMGVSFPSQAQQPQAQKSGAQQPGCIADWSEAGPIVRREGLAPIERVGRLARDRASVEIVTSTLCRAEDRYVYRLTVRGGHGALRTLVVDARRPFDP